MCQSHFLLSLANPRIIVILCLGGNLNALHCGQSFQIRRRKPGILEVLPEPRARGISIHLETKHLFVTPVREMDLLRETYVFSEMRTQDPKGDDRVKQRASKTYLEGRKAHL